MSEKVHANASPEKRLFISLITRDISLIDAFLDIIDNSINAALEPLSSDLKTADDYQRLANSKAKPKVEVEIKLGNGKIVVRDTAPGISLATAEQHVFRFGRGDDDGEASDRLSVYGIGLKRAMFKCGNKIHIVSDHRQGGFELKLNVREWARVKEEPWQFEITPRPPTKTNLGTSITITELYDDVARRMTDGLFSAQLQERIARTYSFFIGRVVNISVNSNEILKEVFEIGGNYASEKFKVGKVSCNITAGIAKTNGDVFRDKNAGWFVFCNGRAILFADKTSTTGWAGAGLPIFQPKHRPFFGTVFFVSSDPEALPWTTTKAAVNEESAVWQEAKRHMIAVGRVVIGFLDSRYTDEGTEVAPSELQEASGAKVSVLNAAVANQRAFKPPVKAAPREMRIQYSAKTADIKKIATHLRKPNMGGSEVGRFTFNHYLKNEVGNDD